MDFRPEGAATDQPRASPWDHEVKPSSTLKGRHKAPEMFRPFRARVSTSDPIPGRCPGLICGCPFGAKEKDTGLHATVAFVRDLRAQENTNHDEVIFAVFPQVPGKTILRAIRRDSPPHSARRLRARQIPRSRCLRSVRGLSNAVGTG